jgi:Protein of unknown function (DUF3540)
MYFMKNSTSSVLQKQFLHTDTALNTNAIHTGKVIAHSTENWVVQEAGCSYRLRRAVSCLIAPMAGDTVAWIPGSTSASGWIVAVLERDSKSKELPAELVFDTGLNIKVNGNWEVRADEIGMQAKTAKFKLNHIKLSFESFKSIGKLAQNTVQQVRWVGQEFSAVVDRWFQHSKSHQRHTDGIECARAETLDFQAKAIVKIEAPNVLTEGSTLVKTRGSQIHFG